MNELEHALETLVDKHSLKTIVSALIDVCYAKAQHLEENWQDRAGARWWEYRAKKLSHALEQF